MEQSDTAPWKDRLRLERIGHNWRQHELAEKLGTSVVTIQRWEQGSHQPSPYFRVKLCALFGKSAQELGLAPDDWLSAPPSAIKDGARLAREETVLIQRAVPSAHSPAPLEIPGQVYDPALPSSLLKNEPLVSRVSEVHLLKQRLLIDAGSLALSGLPGVGKTALAIALTQDREIAASFRNGMLWASLGREPDRFRLLSRWANLLGLTSREMTTAKTPRFDVLAEMVRDAIGTRRMLLILDDAWDIRTALDFRVGGRHCVHLVTTRFPPVAVHFAGKHALALGELNEEESLALLRQFAPTVVTDALGEVRDLVRSVGGLPLALTLMGKYLQVQAHDRQPRRLRKALEELHRLDARLYLTTPQASIDHHPSLSASTSLSLQAAIEISEQQLDEETREKFRTLSLFPAKPHSFSELAAVTICGLSEADLDQLTDTGLLESHSPGRYMLHQTIADYAQQHRTCTAAEESMAWFFVALLKEHHQDHALLEQEHMNIVTALEIALRRGMTAALVQGANRFAPFLIARGLYPQAEHYLHQARQAALSTGDDEELTRTWFSLGRIARIRGDLRAAEHAYLEGLTGARKIANKDLMSQLLGYAGDIMFNRGDWRRAEGYLQEGLRLSQELGNPSLAGLILRNLGEIADEYHGDPVQGNAYYLQGLELARQSNEWQTMGPLLQNLGVKAEKSGAYTQAEHYYEEGLACAQRIHDTQQISAFLMNMGMLAFRQQRYAQAETHYWEALRLARKTENRPRESAILQNLGILAGAGKQWQEAEVYLQKSLEMASSAGHDWLYHETLHEIGELHLKREQIAEAEQVFQEVFSQAEHSGAQQLKASALYGLARVDAARNNVPEAYRKGQASRVLFARMENVIEKQIGEWLDHLCRSQQ